MSEKINILVTVNDKYIKPLQVMLDSLFQHEHSPLDIYLIYSDISKKNLNLLNSYIQRLKGNFIPILLKHDFFRDAPIKNYFTKEMYYRILCSELLPQTLERVLYLDPDILIRGSIRNIYTMDFNGKTIMGVPDTYEYIDSEGMRKRKKTLGLPKNHVYISSGVLLFNLPKMRKNFILKDFLIDIEKNRALLRYPDQDEINIFFQKEIGTIDLIYNYPTLWKLFIHERKHNTIRKNPVIVHYTGSIKPWDLQYIGRYFFEYYRYLRKLQTKKEKRKMLLKPFICIIQAFKYIASF